MYQFVGTCRLMIVVNLKKFNYPQSPKGRVAEGMSLGWLIYMSESIRTVPTSVKFQFVKNYTKTDQNQLPSQYYDFFTQNLAANAHTTNCNASFTSSIVCPLMGKNRQKVANSASRTTEARFFMIFAFKFVRNPTSLLHTNADYKAGVAAVVRSQTHMLLLVNEVKRDPLL